MGKRTLGLLMVLLAFSAGTALAKKGGGKPKPPPDPVDTGTIYYQSGGVVNAMDPDGGGQTALPVDVPWQQACEPSVDTHACAAHGTAERWFLQVLPYDSDPGDGVTETYPNGIERHELFAVCENGTAYRLTDDADLEPCSQQGLWDRARTRWATDAGVTDGKVSYLARQWAQDANDEWYIEEYGLYVLAVEPDDLDLHVPSAPTRIPVAFDLSGLGARVLSSYDWNPAGDAFVYYRRVSQGLWRADYDAQSGTWSTEDLATSGKKPRWSPTASRILFMVFVRDSNGALMDNHIASMDPYDPTDRTTVIEMPRSSGKWSRKVNQPFWSPNGTHVVYQQIEDGPSGPPEDFVYRATSSGSDKVELTGGVPLGWR